MSVCSERIPKRAASYARSQPKDWCISKKSNPTLSLFPIWVLKFLVLMVAPIVLPAAFLHGKFIEELDNVVSIVTGTIRKVD